MSTITLTFQGELVKASVSDDVVSSRVNICSSTRGIVTTFSRKSRKRLFEQLAVLDWKHTTARFVTLTYHNKIPTVKTAKRHLRAFFKRVWRKYGLCPVLWRMEFQKRGAPHFHMFFFNGRYMERWLIREMWRNIVGDVTIDQVDVRAVRNHRQARAYLSKYIAKLPDGETDTALFNARPYLAADGSCGRLWGVENRTLFLLAVAVVIQTIDIWAFWQLKRAARRVYRAINGRERDGFTLFVGNASRWYEYLLYFLLA